MPFIALDKETMRRIDITRIERPRETLKSKEFLCQLCEGKMIVKDGKILQAHFSHAARCPTDYQAHPESEDHQIGKVHLAKRLKAEFPEYVDAEIEYEVPIKQIKRIVDVLVTCPNGWRDAHEIQLSSITTRELEVRTNDYLRAGIYVFWWLGKSAKTPANETWCKRVFGRTCTLEF